MYLKANTSSTISVETPFCVTNVVLDKTKKSKKGEVQVWLIKGNLKFLIASVSRTIPQVTVNLSFELGETFTLFSQGDVYLSGNYIFDANNEG